jgi:hypothetical protein
MERVGGLRGAAGMDVAPRLRPRKTPLSAAVGEKVVRASIRRRMFEARYPPRRAPHEELGKVYRGRALKEVVELPAGLRAERVVARVVEAPAIVSASSDGSYKLNFRELERDDVYYLFSLGGDSFLAKRDRGTVKVFEAYRDGDRMLALPMYEVEVS